MQKADIRERLRRKAGDPGWPNDEREQVIQDTRTPVKGKVYVHEAKREIFRHITLSLSRTVSLYKGCFFKPAKFF